MPLLSLYDSGGTPGGVRDGHVIGRCRHVIDYVDLVKTDVLIQENGQITLKRCKPAAAKIQYGNHFLLQSGWKELPLLQHDRNSPERQLVLTSTPSYRRHDTREPNHINIHSLPPSSPLVSFSEGSEAIVPPEGDFRNSDPFGFLAAEKKHKAQRPRCSPITSYPERLLEEHSSHDKADGSREAFATSSETSLTVNKHGVSAPVAHKKRSAVSESPSASLQTNRLDTSSPSRKAMRHRLTTRREVIGANDKARNKDMGTSGSSP